MPSRIRILAAACLALSAPALRAQPEPESAPPAASEPVFELGQVVVQGRRGGSAGGQNVSAEQIRRFDARNLAQALDTQTGVSIDMIGGRNEAGLRLRGYDARQVPVFLDGIPQYVPYDGYVDFARFLTPSLSEIRLEKGGASLMYGPNTLGGAVNLVTRRPQKAFEGAAEAGLDDTGAKNLSLNLGGGNDAFYVQGSAAYAGSSTFRLPEGFRDLKTVPTDVGRYRENAAHTDRHYALKIGLTPNATDEYAVGYNAIRSEKQQPAYAGGQGQARYWRWPYWNKDSVYFIGNTQLGGHSRLKVRLYRDTYKNGLQMYRDAAYQTPDGGISAYRDQTAGAAVHFSTAAFNRQLWQFGYQYKSDRHQESDGETYRDALHQFAAEHQIDFNPAWRLRSGLDYGRADTKTLPAAFHGSKNDTVNGLLELNYRPNAQHTFYGVVSGKSRFPSIKDRYSFRMGRAIPNPGLQPERANHFELGWRGKPWAGAEIQAAAFYSRLRNEIQNAYVPDSGRQCRRSPVRGFCRQAQNIGRTRHAGIELGIGQDIGTQWKLGLNYTYLSRKDLGGEPRPLLDTPRHKLFAFAEYWPTPRLGFQTASRAESGRRSAYGSGTRTLGGFAAYDAKLVWRPLDALTWEGGVKNIGNKHYELSDGYPMPGRTWFTRLRYAF